MIYFQTSEESNELMAQSAIEMWADKDYQTPEKPGQQRNHDAKPISSRNFELVEPNFKMATVIEITP